MHRTEASQLRQESLVSNGKRKSSLESDSLDYFGYGEEPMSSKRCKSIKGSPDSPPLQGNSGHFSKSKKHLTIKQNVFF